MTIDVVCSYVAVHKLSSSCTSSVVLPPINLLHPHLFLPLPAAACLNLRFLSQRCVTTAAGRQAPPSAHHTSLMNDQQQTHTAATSPPPPRSTPGALHRYEHSAQLRRLRHAVRAGQEVRVHSTCRPRCIWCSNVRCDNTPSLHDAAPPNAAATGLPPEMAKLLRKVTSLVASVTRTLSLVRARRGAHREHIPLFLPPLDPCLSLLLTRVHPRRPIFFTTARAKTSRTKARLR